MKLCCPISGPVVLFCGFIGMTSATGFMKENGVLWIDPPEEKAKVFLNEAVRYHRSVTVCSYSDGEVKLEVSPKEMIKLSYDAKTMCEDIRCLLETGEACWD